MSRKRLLTVSLLLPFMAISGIALADHNYQHRSNEARSYSPHEPFAMERKAPIRRVARGHKNDQKNSNAVKPCTFSYQGGPKSGSWACR